VATGNWQKGKTLVYRYMGLAAAAFSAAMAQKLICCRFQLDTGPFLDPGPNLWGMLQLRFQSNL